MKIFISWSGKLSLKVALLLEWWLPSVIQALDPYVSKEGINKGARWFSDISRELQDTHFGILCLTHKNLIEPWILFEAGALAKSVDRPRMVPLLVNLSPSDLVGPLAQFQATQVEKDDMHRLLKTINSLQTQSRISNGLLDSSFNRSWPEFETRYQEILTSETDVAEEEAMTVGETVNEIFNMSRTTEKVIKQLKNQIVDIRIQMMTHHRSNHYRILSGCCPKAIYMA